MVRTRLMRALAALALAASTVVAFQSPASAAAGESGPWYMWGTPAYRCIDNPHGQTANNITMDIYNCLRDAQNEQWKFEETDNHYVIIRNVTSQKCLTVKNASTENNYPILQFDCNLGYNQQWLPEPTYPDGVSDFYQLRNRHSGRCLTVKNASTANGATLLQYTCDPWQSNNQWTWGAPSSPLVPYV